MELEHYNLQLNGPILVHIAGQIVNGGIGAHVAPCRATVACPCAPCRSGLRGALSVFSRRCAAKFIHAWFLPHLGQGYDQIKPEIQAMIVVLTSPNGSVEYKASEVKHAKDTLEKGFIFRHAIAASAGKVLLADADRHLRPKAEDASADLVFEGIVINLAEVGLPVTLFDAHASQPSWADGAALLLADFVMPSALEKSSRSCALGCMHSRRLWTRGQRRAARRNTLPLSKSSPRSPFALPDYAPCARMHPARNCVMRLQLCKPRLSRTETS